MLEVCKDLERNGYRVTWLDVDGDGNLDVGQFVRALGPDTLLVSIMHANNETGVVFPIEQLARLTKETDPAIVFHCDATQSVGKMPIDLAAGVPARRSAFLLGPQAARPQGHRRAVRQARHALPAAVDRRAPGGRPPGGHGERAVHRRPGQGHGTGRSSTSTTKQTRVRGLRDRLERSIEATIPNVQVNGRGAPRLPNTLNVSCHFVEGEGMLYQLSDAGICASSGSACTSGSLEPSHVLRAMKVPFTAVHGSVRFSFSRYNTDADIDRILEVFPGVVANLRRLSPYWDQQRNAPRADAEELVRANPRA